MIDAAALARSRWGPVIAALGAAALARALLGVEAYPHGDDFAYGPLARLAADPTLYPGDEQLRSISSHTWLYSWLWRAADATLGVAPVFMALTLAIAGAVGLGVLAIMRAVGAAGWFAAPALFLAVAVETQGVGRGDYGGAFTDHFHSQGVAIALCLFAFAATLGRRPVPAGALLGLAALAHPLLALHAAAAVGCGWLALGRAGLRPLALTALVSALIAAPAQAPLLLNVSEAAVAAPTARMIAEGYYFRAAHHYLIAGGPLLLLALYLALGATGAAALRHRAALGLMAFFGAQALAIFAFHAAAFDAPFRYFSTLVYVLDLTRSTPLLWVLASALGFAALEAPGGGGRLRAPLIAALAAVAVLNVERSAAGGVLAATGLALILVPMLRRVAPAALALVGAAALAVVVARTPTPTPPGPGSAPLLAWAATETAPDEMFIAPPLLGTFREYARRPLYVSFRLVSMSQPAHVWLTRVRHEEITPGFEAIPPRAGGWEGARLWTIAYGAGNTPARIAALLARTGATYFIGFTAAGHAAEEIRAAGLNPVYADDIYVVYRRSGS